MTTCPKCGYVRQPTDTAPDYECPKCKIIYSKFDPAAEKRRQADLELKRQKAAEAEAQRLEKERQTAEMSWAVRLGEKHQKAEKTKCPYCGYDLVVGSWISCPQCKTKLQTCSICEKNKADLYSKEKGFFCSDCKNKPKAGQILCPICKTMQEERAECLNCGVSFDKMKIDCPACGEKIPFRAETCSNCGVRFSNIPIKDSPTKESSVNLPNLPKCPKCGSSSIATVKKGYDAGSGCCGTILLGPLGLLCGATGSNQIYNVCQKCGNKWLINS